jgi:hypothetical protein
MPRYDNHDLESVPANFEAVWHEQTHHFKLSNNNPDEVTDVIRVEIWIQSSDHNLWTGARFEPSLGFNDKKTIDLNGDIRKVRYKIPEDWGETGKVQFRRGFSWGEVVDE